MTYKTITVHVNSSRHALDRIRLAAQLARENDAHLVGVAATGLPRSFQAAGMTGEGGLALSVYLDFMKEHAATSLAAFENTVNKAGVRTFEKSMIDEEAGDALCLQGRYSDLIVVGQTDPDERLPAERTDVPEYVVLNSGRPVLLIPYAGKFEVVGHRVIVAWDGSVEAARAVTAALPLLSKAKQVQVVVFNPSVGPDGHGEVPGADIALYLARHGLNVDVSSQNTGDSIDIGNAVLSYACDFGADLLVMGGYGHARLREVVLGGVTDTILHAMTVPVLMSH
ncbi:universal stress protein [Noviherbaspirillum sp.]|uniref:universal stress protein n=1 Tax=Noviherbaspirillum sp. TaxID=1926288 RepID=UPI002FE00866